MIVQIGVVLLDLRDPAETHTQRLHAINEAAWVMLVHANEVWHRTRDRSLFDLDFRPRFGTESLFPVGVP